LLVALLAATAAAYAVTKSATLQVSPILAAHAPAVFSPVCRCDTSVANIDFTLRRPDRVTVWIERDGKRVRTLARERSFEAGLVPLAFAGVAANGKTLPEGLYRPVVHLDDAHRTIAFPGEIRIDTTPPTVHAPRRIYTHISPDGDGHNDVFSVPYRLSEPGHAILIVDGRRAVVSPRASRRGIVRWNGKVDGRAVRPGNHVLAISASDLAGNRAKPRPFAVVQVRYVELGRDRVLAAPGTRFAILALADAPQVSWLFDRVRGTARPGTLHFVAPRKPGVYRLYVSAGGHSVKALVVVA
jgi:hypothetical protein